MDGQLDNILTSLTSLIINWRCLIRELSFNLLDDYVPIFKRKWVFLILLPWSKYFRLPWRLRQSYYSILWINTLPYSILSLPNLKEWIEEWKNGKWYQPKPWDNVNTVNIIEVMVISFKSVSGKRPCKQRISLWNNNWRLEKKGDFSLQSYNLYSICSCDHRLFFHK